MAAAVSHPRGADGPTHWNMYFATRTGEQGLAAVLCVCRIAVHRFTLVSRSRVTLFTSAGLAIKYIAASKIHFAVAE